MKKQPVPTAKNYIPILLVMVIWGSMGIPSTYAVKEFSSLWILCIRSGIAAAVLFPCVYCRCGTVKPDKRDVGLIFLSAVIGVVLCNYLYFYAIKHTTLTNDAILYAFGPIMTTVLAAAVLKESIRQSRLLGILLAFGGVVALITDGDWRAVFTIGFNGGDIAQILSSLCLAIYTVLSKKIKHTPPECVVFWLMTISFLLTLPMVLIMEGEIQIFASGRVVLSLLYLGVLCSGAGYRLQQQSIKKIGASASAAFLNGISPITILLAAVVLGETITVRQAGCMLLIFLGVFLNAGNRDFTILKKYKSTEKGIDK